MSSQSLNVVIMSGSIRQGRQTHKLSVYLYEQFKKKLYVNAILIDLAQVELPLLAKNPEEYIQTYPVIAELSQLFLQADAVVWVSPEYHGSFSGVLKNALDYFWHEFRRKPVGVAAAANGKFGGINASTQMQQLALSIGSYTMPYKLIVPYIDRVFDAQNIPIDKNFIENVVIFIDELLWFAEAIAKQKTTTNKRFD